MSTYSRNYKHKREHLPSSAIRGEVGPSAAGRPREGKQGYASAYAQYMKVYAHPRRGAHVRSDRHAGASGSARPRPRNHS